MSMTEPGGRDRRTRAQVAGAIIAIAALLWALLVRDDVELTPFHAAVGWIMVAGLALYLFLVWRRRG